MRSRIAARNDAPRDSHVASFILLPRWGEGDQARRWVSQRLASFASATAPQCGLAICWTGSSLFKVPTSNASACSQRQTFSERYEQPTFPFLIETAR